MQSKQTDEAAATQLASSQKAITEILDMQRAKHGTTAPKVKIGILTQPINAGQDSNDVIPDQYVLDINRQFIELSGVAEAVPLRYDLIHDEKALSMTLDNLDGVLFTGGFLSLRVYKYAPVAVKTFYSTAKYVFQYALANMMPILGICQGFQLIQLLVADIAQEEEAMAIGGESTSSAPSKSDLSAQLEKLKLKEAYCKKKLLEQSSLRDHIQQPTVGLGAGNSAAQSVETMESAPIMEETSMSAVRRNIRDVLLTDLRMFNQSRTTVWQVDNPREESQIFSMVSEEVLEKMQTEKLAFHAHNWAITKKTFEKTSALTAFYKVIATDDGLAQGYADNEQDAPFEQFITSIQSKDYPIFGSLFHPEYQLMDFFPDPAKAKTNPQKAVHSIHIPCECFYRDKRSAEDLSHQLQDQSSTSSQSSETSKKCPHIATDLSTESISSDTGSSEGSLEQDLSQPEINRWSSLRNDALTQQIAIGISSALSKFAKERQSRRIQLNVAADAMLTSQDLHMHVDESLNFMRVLKIDGLDYFVKACGITSLTLI